MWGALYIALVAALVVRVRSAGAPAPAPLVVPRGEPLWLTRVHHALFVLLLAAPALEALLLGGAARGRALGATLFAVGVVLYRLGAQTLGVAVSPFVTPREGAPLVTEGLYRHVRHPMYLGEALIALGAPLILGSRLVIWLALPALIVLGTRIAREERILARVFPDYARYAARTKRLFPFLY